MTGIKSSRGNSRHADAVVLPVQISQDEAMAELIKGINRLIAQASSVRLSSAAQILLDAKEELVHWAVTMNFHETAKDQFINHHLCDSGLFVLGEFLAQVAAMDNTELKSQILRMLGTAMIAQPAAPARREDMA